MSRRLGVLVALLTALAVLAAAPPAAAHLGADEDFTLSRGQDPLVDALSLAALLGSGAAPLVYAMSDPELPLYSAAQVANVWLLAAAVRMAARRP